VAEAAPLRDPLPSTSWPPRSPLDPSARSRHTRLAADWHLQSDDAVALTTHVCDPVDVDPSSFRFDRFFARFDCFLAGEGGSPRQLLLSLLLLPALLAWWAIRHGGRRPGTDRPITVAACIEATGAHRWPLA